MQRKFDKVFGVGLPKTGTTTLGAMLRRLGYNHAPYDRQLILRYLEGDRSALAVAIERYDSFEDWPWPLAYAELAEFAPDAAFILTVRKDAPTWIGSATKHSAVSAVQADATKRRIQTEVVQRVFGAGSPETHPEQWMAAYQDHNARVRRFFDSRADRFIELCWETGQGWPELCAFLGHPIVDESLPHENSHESRRQRHQSPSIADKVRRGIRKFALGSGQPTRAE